MGQKQIELIRRHQFFYTLQMGTVGKIIHADYIEPAVSKAQHLSLMPKEKNVQLATFPLSIGFHVRVPFVVSETTPNARGIAQPLQFVKTSVQRVVPITDQIAGNYYKIGWQPVCGVYNTDQVRRKKERPQVNITDLQNSQSIQIGGKIGKLKIDFVNLEILP